MTITRRKAKSRVVNEMSEIELGKRFIAATGKISALANAGKAVDDLESLT